MTKPFASPTPFQLEVFPHLLVSCNTESEKTTQGNEGNPAKV
jgi:hypothetical protein